MTTYNDKWRRKKKFEGARENVKYVVGFYNMMLKQGKVTKEHWEERMKELHELDLICFKEINNQ